MSDVGRAARYVLAALILGIAVGVLREGSVVGGLALGVFVAVGVTFGLVFYEFVSRVS
ncbi:hypothetical protein ACFQJC_09690 [Haloferax namakaokahaiae]|uniref:Uncharacterized protein n=1 Tax=Haloferax namakaokahaiae TaxID=1748331 RepID=A0ABD5ZEY0_9EURY